MFLWSHILHFRSMHFVTVVCDYTMTLSSSSSWRLLKVGLWYKQREGSSSGHHTKIAHAFCQLLLDRWVTRGLSVFVHCLIFVQTISLSWNIWICIPVEWNNPVLKKKKYLSLVCLKHCSQQQEGLWIILINWAMISGKRYCFWVFQI